MDTQILHFDLDSFFVAVECKNNPRLKGRPLIVGGSSRRGVVAACSYEARRFGVHSAMPMYLALRLCPDATVISGDMDSYTSHSQLVTDIMAGEAPLFEKASIDEFYIDASGMDRFVGTFRWARELRHKIMRESGLPISMAMSVNKMVSKVATGEFKPDAEKQIAAGTEQDFLAPLPVERLPMVGKQTAAFLHDMGVRTVATLRAMPVKVLTQAFGRNGVALWNKAHGLDDSPVVPYVEQKSISTETTFSRDTTDVQHIHSLLVGMVEKIAFQLRSQQKLASCVTVKIRYADFDTETKQVHVPYTASDHHLLPVVRELFDRLYNRRMLIRLVGVRLSGLVHGSPQIRLFEDTGEQVSLYAAIDRLRERHGVEKVVRAAGMSKGE